MDDDSSMDDDLGRRIEALKRMPSYQAWSNSFSDPVKYNPQFYSEMNLRDDFALKFDNFINRDCTVKVPIVFVCSMSSLIREEVRVIPSGTAPRLRLQRSDGFPFWWLMYYIKHKSLLPDAKGMSLVLKAMIKHGIEPISHMSFNYLCCGFPLDDFPYVFNVAVEHEIEKLLDLCGNMIAAWSDEVLSSPCLPLLGDNAMRRLILHPNLSPSSEVLVFSAVVNWGRTRDKTSRCTIEFCLRYVRFFLLTEKEFVNHVLPSGLIPFEEASLMIETLRQQARPIQNSGSFIFDPVTQRTPRPKLLMTVTFGEKPQEVTKDVTPIHTKEDEKLQLAWFKVDQPILMRRLGSGSLMEEGGGKLLIKNQSTYIFSAEWKNLSCTFEQPLACTPGNYYHLEYETKTERTDKELCNRIGRTVGGVTFDGMLFCQNLFLEFVVIKPCGPASVDALLLSSPIKVSDSMSVKLAKLGKIGYARRQMLQNEDFEHSRQLTGEQGVDYTDLAGTSSSAMDYTNPVFNFDPLDALRMSLEMTMEESS